MAAATTKRLHYYSERLSAIEVSFVGLYLRTDFGHVNRSHSVRSVVSYTGMKTKCCIYQQQALAKLLTDILKFQS